MLWHKTSVITEVDIFFKLSIIFMDEERKFNLSVDIKEKKKSGTVLMTEGSIWKKLLIFSVPLILGNL